MREGFINVGNGRSYKRKGKTRHHLVLCAYCFTKFKILSVHFKRYHPEELKEITEDVRNAIGKGQIGEINGIRFIKTGN